MKGRDLMKTTMDISQNKISCPSVMRGAPQPSKLMIFSLMCVSALGLLLGGCADGTYATAYYAPDYGPYYSDYGYAGEPYYGYDPGYYGGFDVSGTRYHRYYGAHHFSRDFRSSNSSSVRTTAPRSSVRVNTPSAPRAPNRR
jgi:hypothetical protein